ncbi:hypothetical protein FF1_039577 [Malus domestica]
MAVDSLFNTSHPDVKSRSLKGRQAWVSHVYKTSTSTNATSWVEAALGANISKFSLFRAQGNGGIPNGEMYHYVVVENAPAESNLANSTPQTKQNRPRIVPALKKMSTERDQYPKENRLKETARLAEKLLFVCCEWFLKYLEDSLNVGFRLNKEEGIPEIARLLGQLKRVNLWLDDLIKGRIYVDKRIKSLKKKLYEVQARVYLTISHYWAYSAGQVKKAEADSSEFEVLDPISGIFVSAFTPLHDFMCECNLSGLNSFLHCLH